MLRLQMGHHTPCLWCLGGKPGFCACWESKLSAKVCLEVSVIFNTVFILSPSYSAYYFCQGQVRDSIFLLNKTKISALPEMKTGILS